MRGYPQGGTFLRKVFNRNELRGYFVYRSVVLEVLWGCFDGVAAGEWAVVSAWVNCIGGVKCFWGVRGVCGIAPIFTTMEPS